MKMDMSAKPEVDGKTSPSNAGTYDQDELDCMLDHFLEAKKIEADPKLFAMIKDYAMSKNKMVQELFATPPKVKSLKDLKSKADYLAKTEMADDEG